MPFFDTITAQPSLWVSLGYTLTISAWIAIQKFPVRFLQAHYGALSLFSLVTFLGITYSAWQVAHRHGSLLATMCVTDNSASGLPPALDEGMKFWMELFHYSKYWEIVDTIIILAKGRPLTFLHVFHHALVLLQSRSWLEGELAFTWVGVAFNSFVHIVMYYFYFVGASGGRVSWRGRITQLQIFQFVCSFGVFAWFASIHMDPSYGPCKGWEESAFSVAFNVALLFLFLRLAAQNERQGTKKSN